MTTLNLGRVVGRDGAPGQDGEDGRGIVSILKTATQGNVDTYTITYTDNTTSTFEVTNGLDGQDGAPGQDGQDGDDGRGIVNIEKTSTSGLVDTYTITYSDGTTSTFEVTNGSDGGTGDYTDLENKPSINNVTLSGNKTSSDLGVQDALVSGTNIKTINNESILGSGDIEIEGGSANPLADKNIVVFGDSLTDPQSGGTAWTESFINIARYKSFRGYGRGYCTWTFKNNTEYNITDNTDANVGSNVIWNQFNKLKHDVDNENTPAPDILMIFCADNDIMQGKTIGTESATFKASAQSSDVKTLTNMMDSIRYNIDTINAEYPNCIIIPIIPLLPSRYADSKTYRDALITCYNNLGLSYIDVMYGSGIAWYREMMKRVYFASDGVHLSPSGSMKVASYIYQSLITMPRIQKVPDVTTTKSLYNVYYTLTNATSTNSFASVMQGEPYRATISATTGHVLTSVTCTMGGATQPVTGGLIDIASVTGDIRITAVGGDPTPTTYTITNNLTNATNSNAATSAAEGTSYTATISANQGYHITSISCTMGGVEQPVVNNTISLASVSGNIVITAVAEQDPTTYTVTNNLTNATNSNAATSVEEGASYTATISANTGYHITSIACTMGGTQQTVTNNTINIASVSGDIVITAVAEQDQPTPTTYTVTNNLTNATSSNAATSVTEGDPYTATISANTGYHMTSIACTMGGVTQTVTDNTINIASVNGNIIITAVAEEDQPTVYYTVTNNLTNTTNSNPAVTVEEGTSYTATISASQGYNISSVTCTMGGVEQTVTDNTISIVSVSGNIVITATATQFVPVEGAYIHNDGDCWVGSSYYTSKNTTKVEVVAEIHSYDSAGYSYLVGSSDTKLCQWKNGVNLACVAGTATQTSAANWVTVSFDKKFTVVGDIANETITITDEDGTRTGTIAVGTTYKPEPIWYFAGYWQNSFEHKSGDMKVYSMKIWEGDTLVYEGYPVNDANGAGMYDTISGDTHYNEGTGTLTYGVDPES